MTVERDAYGRFVKRGGNDGRRPVDTVQELDALLVRATTHAARRVLILAYQAISTETPVDLGTARSRWVVSVGAPILDPPQIAGLSDEEVKALAAKTHARNQARAESVGGKYRIEQGSVFIANATPWIVPLNEGSSSQAPAKFVERALETAVKTAEREVA
jgi:hypothetical protein